VLLPVREQHSATTCHRTCVPCILRVSMAPQGAQNRCWECIGVCPARLLRDEKANGVGQEKQVVRNETRLAFERSPE
jgi:hypothetical protein